jgi:hypothetical protein
MTASPPTWCPECRSAALVPAANGREIFYVCAACGWNKERLKQQPKKKRSGK